LDSLGDRATDSVPEDAALWSDAMGENKSLPWTLPLLIGTVIVIGAVAVWRYLKGRKK